MHKLVDQILEYKYSNFMRKQKSVTSLFPQFPQRVSKVAANGGTELVNVQPETWTFEVASGTTPGLKYSVVIRFRNIDEMIRKFALNRRLWNKAGDNVDLRLLAAEILNNVDIEADCSCLADTYWGPEHIKTRKDAQFGDKEFRAPNIRNPKQYGVNCKHAHLVFMNLPMYTTTFAKHLRDFYSKDIENVVGLALKRVAATKKATTELGRKDQTLQKPVAPAKEPKTLQEPKTPEGEAPKESIVREATDIFKPASNADVEQRKVDRIDIRMQEILSRCTKNSDGTYSCDGGVYLGYLGLTGLPVKFKHVGGNFYCINNSLTSLDGAPTSVGGNFYCDHNSLTSLEGAPTSVGGSFYCINNSLTSLEGAPTSVGGSFYCDHNSLTSLSGAPTSVGGSFDCSNNKLTSLDGAPTSVGGSFYCINNSLTSLEGAPTSVGGSFCCSNNKVRFTEQDVRKVCKVKGKIYV